MVTKDVDSLGFGMTCAHAVPDESTSKLNFDTLEKCVSAAGNKCVILKRDQQPSNMTLKDVVRPVEILRFYVKNVKVGIAKQWCY